jgi:hypothetical protein
MTSVIERTATSAAAGAPAASGELREEALRRLEKKREFRLHLSTFVVVNAFLWLIWGVVFWFTGFWFPWPVFPLAGWGIGLGFHAWDVYGNRPFTAEQIEREAARLRGGR